MLVNTQNTLVRDLTVKYLYQSDIIDLFFFSGGKFDEFSEYYHVKPELATILRGQIKGLYRQLPRVNQHLKTNANLWSVSRMPVLDRIILQSAVFELISEFAPAKVIINEAVKLAKKYGTERSAQYVNGVLDSVAREVGAF